MATLHNVLDPLPGGRTRTQPSPLTQFATKERPGHWGTDLRASEYDTPGDRVYLPADATLVASGVGDGSPSARIPFHSGRYQYWDLGVWGGDRMYLYLGHLHSLRYTTPGVRVRAGVAVAVMGGSGAGGVDRFVDHLHLGVAQNTTRPGHLLRSGRGWIDPVRWFRLRGVDLNKTLPAGAYALAGAANTTTTEEDPEMTPEQMQELKEYIQFQAKSGAQWATMGYDDAHAMAVHHELRVGVKALRGQVQALTEVITELASNTTALTPEAVTAMLQRIEDRAVDAIANDYEITKKEG